MAVTLGRSALVSNVTLLVSQGATNVFSFTWADAAGTEEDPLPPVPRDLTGYKARCQARKRHSSAAAWFTLTDVASDDGVIELDSAGRVVLTLAPAASSAWGTTNTRGVWDLKLASPAGLVTRLAEGPVVVALEATKDAE